MKSVSAVTPLQRCVGTLAAHAEDILGTIVYASYLASGITTRNSVTRATLTSLGSARGKYSQIYWQANNADVYSHIVQETAGNSLVTTRDYSQATGNLLGIAVGPGYNVENMSYGWDNVGNLLARVDSLNGIAEGFCYDALNQRGGSVKASPLPIESVCRSIASGTLS